MELHLRAADHALARAATRDGRSRHRLPRRPRTRRAPRAGPAADALGARPRGRRRVAGSGHVAPRVTRATETTWSIVGLEGRLREESRLVPQPDGPSRHDRPGGLEAVARARPALATPRRSTSACGRRWSTPTAAFADYQQRTARQIALVIARAPRGLAPAAAGLRPVPTWSTEQNRRGSGARRGGARATTRVALAARSAAQCRPRHAAGSPLACLPAGPCIAHGTTCSSRQNAASRAPGCSGARQPSSRLDAVPAPAAARFGHLAG